MSSRGQRTTLQRFKRGDWPLTVHLSSLSGVTEDRAPLPLQTTVLPLPSFSAACQHLDSRPTLTARPNPFWHPCHTVHLSSDLIVALHTQASPSKGKTRLMSEHDTLPSVWIWISTSIQQVLNQFGRRTRPACYCWTWHTRQRLARQSLPSKNTRWGWEGCWHVAVLRDKIAHKELVYSNTR